MTKNPSCPYCGEEADANFVDIGVGMQRVEPWGCHACHSHEFHPYHDDESKATPEEKEKGWWRGDMVDEVLARKANSKQRILWIGEWAKKGMISSPMALPVPLDEKPKRVWTLYGHTEKDKPPKLPFKPVQHDGAFLEDYLHDWNWWNGQFKYYSRVTDKPVWVLLEYE